MLKSAAAVLGFLFALSTAYYLAYWGYFNIDAFQYIAAEDIVKGVAYPLRFAGIWIAGITVFVMLVVGISQVWDNANVSINAKRALYYFSGAFFVTLIGYIVSYIKHADNRPIGMALSTALAALAVAFYVVIYLAHQKAKAAASSNPPTTVEFPLAPMVDYATFFAAILFSVNAIVSGLFEARAIQAGKNYNYILSKDLPEKNKITAPFLIFLGAVSEKYIFIDTTGQERLVIDKEQLPILRIHHYDKSDTATTRHKKICLLDSALTSKPRSLTTNSLQAKEAKGNKKINQTKP